jgi:hypothetical protein
MYTGLGTVVLVVVLYLIFVRQRYPKTTVRLDDTLITSGAFVGASDLPIGYQKIVVPN